MITGSKAATRGYKFERDFVGQVNDDAVFNERLKKALNKTGKLIARKITDNKRKADVELDIVRLNIGKEVIGCSIKTSEADFSQLDRRWLDDLQKTLNMPQQIKERLQECIYNKQRNKKAKFIMDVHKEALIRYFEEVKERLLQEIFIRKDFNLKYLVVCSYAKRVWYITPMKDVINYIRRQKITLSREGQMYFGDCLSLQRKSGDGSHIKIPKSHPNHPGNQLQFKLKPLSIIRNVTSAKTI
jgi:hypothetical protein